MSKEKMSYKKAGVDIDKSDSFVKKIAPLIESTRTPEVLDKFGGFSSIFDIDSLNIENPALVSTTDGVGTKLLLAKLRKEYDTIGKDLVAMCVNDIITSGARPLFLLDYFSTGKLNSKRASRIVKGIVEGCNEAECVLLGGETAEMPDVYQGEDFDLAGFCVGVVDKEKLIDGRDINEKDIILGIQSSGPHSNGFSLIRKVFKKGELQSKLGKKLLTPTFIYTKAILKLIQKVKVKGIAHITGGGLVNNIPRILPEKEEAVLEKKGWELPDIFKEIKGRSGLSYREMYKIFNMGIGMVVILPPDEVKQAQGILRDFYDMESYKIGYIKRGKKKVSLN